MASSREATGAASLAAGLVAVAIAGPWTLSRLADLLQAGLTGALAPGREPAAALQAAALEVARLSAWPGVAAALAGTIAGGLQAGGLLSLQVISPRLERLDPLRGLGRLVTRERLARLVLGLLVAGLLLAVLVGWARQAAPSLAALPRAAEPWRALPALLGPLALRLLGLVVAFGGVELLRARVRHRRALRMTRDEVRRERREDEGDPRHRAERRQLHQRLLEVVPVSRATCLVVNPTHVAVALVHRRDQGEAPRVVAKGTGAAAARLRSEARRAGVPVVRDVALARALHRLAEVGDEIPEELYDAAAAVLAVLYGPGTPERS